MKVPGPPKTPGDGSGAASKADDTPVEQRKSRRIDKTYEISNRKKRYFTHHDFG